MALLEYLISSMRRVIVHLPKVKMMGRNKNQQEKQRHVGRIPRRMARVESRRAALADRDKEDDHDRK